MAPDEAWARRDEWKAAKGDLEYQQRSNSATAKAAPELDALAKSNLKEYEAQRKKVIDGDAVANERKAAIRAGADNTVADAGADKADRLRKEREAADKAKRDREDSAAIRKTRDSESVEIKRAQDDAAAEISKLRPGDTARRREIEEVRDRKTEELAAERDSRKERARLEAERDRKEVELVKRSSRNENAIKSAVAEADTKPSTKARGKATTRTKKAPVLKDNKALKEIANDIGNADTETEIAALGEKIKASQMQLSAAMVGALQKMLADQQGIVKKISELEANIKSTRGK